MRLGGGTMMNMIRHGTSDGDGNITFATKPDYSQGKESSQALGVAGFPVKQATVFIPSTVTGGTVQMQGSNGSPTDDNSWHDIGDPITATGSAVHGVIENDEPWSWVRFVTASYAGSGDIVVEFHAAA